jgi:DNA-binding HxlR family transcriptional regulator
MSIPSKPTASAIESVDAQRVEDALSLIAPKWTTWSAQTLAQQGGPIRVRDVAAKLPFVSEQLVGKRLAQMHADGLVTRTDDRRGAPYQLSAFGASLAPVQRALSDWSRTHLPLGAVAGAERVEEALRRLYLRHSTAVIQALDAGGAMRFVHIAEKAGLDVGLTGLRLTRLQLDGLVTRSGPRHGDVLTNAGRALGPVYLAVEHWSSPVATGRQPTIPVSVAAAVRTHSGDPLGSDGSRTAAALRRSTAAPSSLFSHAPQPQPRVPAAVTARSAPARGR